MKSDFTGFRVRVDRYEDGVRVARSEATGSDRLGVLIAESITNPLAPRNCQVVSDVISVLEGRKEYQGDYFPGCNEAIQAMIAAAKVITDGWEAYDEQGNGK